MKFTKHFFTFVLIWGLVFIPEVFSNVKMDNPLEITSKIYNDKIKDYDSMIRLIEHSDKEKADEIKSYLKKANVVIKEMPAVHFTTGAIVVNQEGHLFYLRSLSDTEMSVQYKDKTITVTKSMNFDQLITSLMSLSSVREKFSMIDFFIPKASAYGGFLVLGAIVGGMVWLVWTAGKSAGQTEMGWYAKEAKEKCEELEKSGHALTSKEETKAKSYIEQLKKLAAVKGNLSRVQEDLKQAQTCLETLITSSPLVSNQKHKAVIGKDREDSKGADAASGNGK